MFQTVTKLKFLDGYKFNIKFDLENVSNLTVDEPKPTGESRGPNPTRLLSAAVGHCLSSSLLYSLYKSRVKVKNVETVVTATAAMNQDGYLRIKDIDVQIRVEVDEEDKPRLSRCLEIFQNYCTVTESVRKGIQVNVNMT